MNPETSFTQHLANAIQRAREHGIPQAAVLDALRAGFDKHPERGNLHERALAWAGLEAAVIWAYSDTPTPDFNSEESR